MGKRFALIGAAGYIAPRHMKAIYETGNQLVAAYDPFDSVGVLDSYFPNTAFFTEFERFDRHLDKLRREGRGVDFVTICSPNYLHDAHIRFALRLGADAICEKPIVLNPWNIDALKALESESPGRVYTILQLRLHPKIVELREKIMQGPPDKVYDITLTYITSRGNWYYTSWKGDVLKSGGIATNIGVHFFDMLQWIFGDVVDNQVHLNEHDRSSGYLVLKRARVSWFLSIDYDTIPDEYRNAGARTYRSLRIGDEEFEFSEGFTNLHTECYKQSLEGNGFSLEDTRNAIQIVYDIRQQKTGIADGPRHPLSLLPLKTHPFFVQR